MSAIIIDGSLVHYETIGRGQPMLFLHGWLGSWRYWMYTMQELAGGQRSYAFDLWGFGDTDRCRGRQHIDDYVRQLEAFQEDLGIGRLTLVGHGLGAAVALKYTSLFPHQVARLMLVSLPATSQAIHRKTLQGGGMLNLFGGYRWQDHEEVANEARKVDPDVFPGSIDDLDSLPVAETLATLPLPVVLVQGGKDTIIRPFPEELLRVERTNTRLIEFDDSHHFPMLEERSKFNRLVKDFIAAENDLAALELHAEWRRRTR